MNGLRWVPTHRCSLGIQVLVEMYQLDLSLTPAIIFCTAIRCCVAFICHLKVEDERLMCVVFMRLGRARPPSGRGCVQLIGSMGHRGVHESPRQSNCFQLAFPAYLVTQLHAGRAIACRPVACPVD